MVMNDGLDVGTGPIDREVKAPFAGWFPATLSGPGSEMHTHEIAFCDKPVIQSRRGDKSRHPIRAPGADVSRHSIREIHFDEL